LADLLKDSLELGIVLEVNDKASSPSAIGFDLHSGSQGTLGLRLQ
jgi:hypothetical protein